MPKRRIELRKNRDVLQHNHERKSVYPIAMHLIFSGYTAISNISRVGAAKLGYQLLSKTYGTALEIMFFHHKLDVPETNQESVARLVNNIQFKLHGMPSSTHGRRM